MSFYLDRLINARQSISSFCADNESEINAALLDPRYTELRAEFQGLMQAWRDAGEAALASLKDPT